MAGMTEKGLTIKRLDQVLTDLRSGAVPIFQDLVPAGDSVDISPSSTLGRMIALQSLPLSDLWEAVQQVYLAFDPNSATGIALDNLVQYAGITREPAVATSVTVVCWGDPNTLIPSDVSSVRATDNTLYDVRISLELVASSCIGAKFKMPSTLVVGTNYSITITLGTTTVVVSYIAQVGDTKTTVVEALASQLSSYSSTFNVATDSDSITIESVDIYDIISVSNSNILLNKIKGRTEVVCQETGPRVQEVGTVNGIATPVFGWDSVNNPIAGVVGKNRETDDELRIRFRESKFRRAQNIADSLYSSLIEIDGVRYAAIYENETDVYDSTYDIPPHSFKPIVLGGNPTDICNAVWLNKPLGIRSVGNTFATILDSQGFQRDIYFERPTSIPVYITLNITTDANTFPADGADQIKSALIQYFVDQFSIGEDVIYSRLYTPINSVQGFQVDSLTIGITPSPTGTSNIVIGFDEIAALNSNDIIVNVS